MKDTKSEKMNQELIGTLCALIGGVCWGVSGVVGQFLFRYKEATATWLVPLRLTFAGFFLLCWFLIRDRKQAVSIWKNKKNARDLVAYGLLGMMLSQYSYFQTVEWSNAGTATVIQYLGPAMIVVVVCLANRRKPEVKEIAAVIMALLGIFLLATHGNPGTLVLSQRALIMGLISALSLVLYTLQPAKLQKQFDTPLILAWGMLIGGIVLSMIFQPWAHMPVVDVQTCGAMAFIVVFGTMAGFSLYMQSVKMIGSVKASLYACIEPVASMILTVIWMKASFTGMDLLGFVLIIATVFVLALPSKKEEK